MSDSGPEGAEEGADPADELAALAADARGWLAFQRSLAAASPWAAAPHLPPPPPEAGRPAEPARGASPARTGAAAASPPATRPARRLPRAADMPAGAAPLPAPPRASPPRASLPVSSDREALDAVRLDLGDCTRCGLHRGRHEIVFGAGNPDADIVFVGEGPGAEEDRTGQPFVGAAGQLLDRIIENVLRLSRDDVYICNVVKCRPPGNRDPEPPEVAACSPFLRRQLASIRPAVVVGLGRFAVNTLLGTPDRALGAARGTVHRLRSGVLVATYHPAYLLRTPGDKRKTMEDMMLVRAEVERATGKALPPPLRGGSR